MSFEASKSFFVASDVVGDGFEGGAWVRDLVRQAGQGAGIGLSGAVLVDDCVEVGVAVEGGVADAGEVSDREKRDLLSCLEEQVCRCADGRG